GSRRRQRTMLPDTLQIGSAIGSTRNGLPRASGGSRPAHVLLHALWADLRAVDVAVGVGYHPFGRARAGRLLHGVRDERRDRAVARAADADAAPPAVMIPRHRLGFRVRDVDDVAFVDVDPARPAELPPHVELPPLLVEDHDAVVA